MSIDKQIGDKMLADVGLGVLPEPKAQTVTPKEEGFRKAKMPAVYDALYGKRDGNGAPGEKLPEPDPLRIAGFLKRRTALCEVSDYVNSVIGLTKATADQMVFSNSEVMKIATHIQTSIGDLLDDCGIVWTGEGAVALQKAIALALSTGQVRLSGGQWVPIVVSNRGGIIDVDAE